MNELLILVPCDDNQKEKLYKECKDRYHVTFGTGADKELVKNYIRQADVIIGEPDMEWIQDAPNLKWIQMTWAGTDKYTRNPGFPEGVMLTSASGAFGVVISEYVIGAILNMYRRFPQYRKNQEMHLWMDMGSERCIYGKRVLILGAGNIGSETAKRLKTFGAYVSGVRRTSLKKEFFDEMHTLKELDEELKKADIVIGCMPNNDDTVGLLDYHRLREMKADTLFVNVGRGHLLQDGSLEKVLLEGHLSGAVLDVESVEPLPQDSVLWDMENVMITPHISGPSFGHSKDTENRIWDICLDNLCRFQEGRKLLNRCI
ncbi:MAG: D-2-hydroxyacid dehydrogenase [Thermoflexaceae bacterium]|nr:D-2-hydroxyacid dehydrogenase [Thermoflexaceae bacterium]